MYFVRGLEFQEAVLRWYEKKYSIEILRIPHFELSHMLKRGLFRIPDDDVPIIGINDIYNYVREKSGYVWIAAGETIADSIWRRAMIKQSGTIFQQRRRIYPVAYFTKQHIKGYIKRNRLKIAPESQLLGDRSFGRFAPETLFKIKKKFPQDYEKIKAWFPFCEASVKKYEIYKTKTGSNEVSKV